MEKERRKHRRIAVMHDLAKTIDLLIELEEWEKHGLHDKIKQHEHHNTHVKMPAVLLNLCASGLGLITFAALPIGTKICLNFDLVGLKMHDIEGKIMWSIDKGDTHRMGVEFMKINDHSRNKLTLMAQDDEDCSIKLELGVTDVCSKKCHYYLLCTKDARLK